MAARVPEQLKAQFQLRLPIALAERLRQSAENNKRSINAEVEFQLEKALTVEAKRNEATA